jgi:hypothetical protein
MRSCVECGDDIDEHTPHCHGLCRSCHRDARQMAMEIQAMERTNVSRTLSIERALTQLPQLTTTDAAFARGAVAIVADETSPGDYKIVVASPLPVETLCEMSWALSEVVADLQVLGARGRL